jgi:hypothetical protein
MIALSKLPKEAVLVIGSRSETIIDPTGPVDWQARALAAESDLARANENAVMLSEALARISATLAGHDYDPIKRVMPVVWADAIVDEVVRQFGLGPRHPQELAARLERWQKTLGDLVDTRVQLADSEGDCERLSRRIAELEYAVGRAKEESAASLAHAETHLAERVKAERERTATACELAKVLGERDNLGDSDAAKRIAADLRRSATGVDFGVPKGPNPIRTAADEVAAHFKTLRSELAKSVERERLSADQLAECESKLRDAIADPSKAPGWAGVDPAHAAAIDPPASRTRGGAES